MARVREELSRGMSSAAFSPEHPDSSPGSARGFEAAVVPGAGGAGGAEAARPSPSGGARIRPVLLGRGEGGGGGRRGGRETFICI